MLTSDVRVRIQATGLDTYPDVTVICGHAQMDVDDRNAVVNPLLLVEVTSPSSAAYDRGAKLQHYRRIRSLREVVLVDHDERRVEVWRRQADASWICESFGPDSSVHLVALDCELPVSGIYRNPLPAE